MTRVRLIGYALATAAIGVLVAVHAHVRLQGEDYASPLLAVDHLFVVLLVLVLLAICAAVGRVVSRRIHLDLGRPLDDLAFSMAIGAAVISTSLLVLGLFSLLRPWIIVLTLFLWTLFSRRELAALPGLCRRSARHLRRHSGHVAFAVTISAILALIAAFLLTQAIAPPTDWDSLMYHLQVPRRFLEHGRVYIPEDNLHVAFVGLVQMLYVPLLAFGDPAGPAILSALLALVLALALFSAAQRFFNGGTASVAVSTLWATTSILLVAITPRVDVTLALYLFLAHYALLIALSDPSQRTYLFVGAALLGCSVGVKYHSLAYSLALAPLILWTVRANAGSIRNVPQLLAIFALVFVLAAAPWLIKNLYLFKAPLYPFFSGRILPPWLASIYGSSAIPPSVDPEAFRAMAFARSPFNLVHLFTAPGLLTVEQEGTYYFMNVLYLLLPLWLFFLRDKWLGWLIVPSVAYLAITLLPFPTTNLRYLIPAIPPLTLAAASIAYRAAHRLLSAAPARTLLLSATLVALFPSAKAMYVWLRKSDTLGYVAGVTSQQTYLETGYFFLSRLVQATREWVPKDAKMLLLFEARGFYFEPAVIQDNVLTNWPLLAPKVSDGSSYCLESTGITHVLVNDAAVRYYMRRGTDPTALRLDLFPDFANRCLVLLYRGRGFSIGRLRSATGG